MDIFPCCYMSEAAQYIPVIHTLEIKQAFRYIAPFLQFTLLLS